MKLAIVTFTAYNQLHKRGFFEEGLVTSYTLKTRIRHIFCKTAVIHSIEWHDVTKINEVNYGNIPDINPQHEKLIEMRNEKSFEIEK